MSTAEQSPGLTPSSTSSAKTQAKRQGRLRSSGLALAATAAAAMMAAPSTADANVVTDWSTIAERATAANVTTTLVHVTMHDTLNAIQRRYDTYAVDVNGPANASPEAAVATAAYRLLMLRAPGAAAMLNTAYANYMAAIPDSPEKTAGILLGEAVAVQEHNLRLAVVSSTPTLTFTPNDAPGYFRITIPGAAPGMLNLANTQPFALNSNEQFLPDEPISLTSWRYARDFEETRRYGSATSTERTAEQTTIANFWRGNFPGLAMTHAAIRLVATRGLDVWESARLLALITLADADSAMVTMRTQYLYPRWRPISAIRLADIDGNPATTADPTWTSFHPTPNHPEYIANFPANVSATATVMALFFGTNNVQVEPDTATLPRTTRTFAQLSDVIADVTNARIWAGLQFRSSCDAGNRVGVQVGFRVFTRYLRPAHGRWSFPRWHREIHWNHHDVDGPGARDRGEGCGED